ncbi:MAG: CehA/McbA family metallohydrolase [Candidatus Altiarchaeales archaeon]|nr:CehA/McbA family metallohydrolase [Candidatus Altiarchaeota archaeon]MBU4266252.1 CehA/McbA family metallohydrolase [Candidatus Altiarchaeota archaeon]MBU4342034.1 CehA/McbA family metallohydrolase [Candidatus Altiarchaeota archaeon]MBU4437488.1 CehA/McbA family metallohydrolase [Candidatus Altiarchaeota archaeon]MCG2781955.1 CehA/McbA family metallohydrolase [Candidatus Altiarchaeales archaeon]
MRKTFDIHIHSNYSDGSNSVGEIVKRAKKIGLDGIAITDHNEIEGSLRAMEFDSAEFRVIPGIEVSSKEGHIVGLGVREVVYSELSAEETVKRIHELGGLAIAVHPYDRIRQGVGDLIYELDFDAVEIYNGHTLSVTKSPEDTMKGLNIPAVCGSDAHCLDEIGMAVIRVKGDPIEAIRNGDVKIEEHIKTSRILMNYFKKRTGLF